MISISRRRSLNRLFLAGLAFLSGALELGAQVVDPAITGMGRFGYGLEARRPGLQLNTISVYSSLMPARSGSAFTGSSGSSWGLMNGVTGSGGLTKEWRNTNLSVMYSGGYSRREQLADSGRVFHNLSLSYFASLKLNPRWDYSLNLNGTVSDFESFLSLPQSSRGLPVSATPIAADPFDPTIGNTPANFALFGRRFLTANLGNSFSFRKSERLTYDFGVDASRTQALSGTGGNRLLNGVISGGANGNLNYKLTSRTQLTGNLTVSRSFSSLFNNQYFTNGMAGVGRTMTPWWYLQARVGVGYNILQGGTVQSRPRVIGGISTSFSGYQQSFSLNASMMASDPFGIGAGTTTSGGASWSWHRPAARWAVSASVTESLSRRPGVGTFTAWGSSAGMNRVLTNQLFFTLSGSYTNVGGLSNFGGLGGGFAGDLGSGFGGGRFGYRGVRAALTWTPTKLRW